MVDRPSDNPALAPILHRLFGSDRPQAVDRLWQGVVDTMNEGLLLVSADRRILYMNRKAEELTGQPLSAVAGAVCTDAIRCPQCACACRLFEVGEVDHREVTVYDAATGTPRTLLKSGRLLRGEGGAPLCGVETFQDVSEEVRQREDARRSAEAAYAEKQERAALLDVLPDGVCVVDADGRLTSVSPRMASMLGIEASTAAGRDLLEVLGVTSPAVHAQPVAALAGRRLEVALPVEAEAHAELTLRRVAGDTGKLVGVLRRLPASSTTDDAPCGFHGILSRAPVMRRLFALIEAAGPTDTTILIQGESGTGKELVARAIHAVSPRREAPFHAVNCATFQGSLLLSELFGHERGAFTGAYRTSRGKLELAGEGTLFLDEVSQIPLPYQGVLLRVLEARVFERVGGSEPIPLRARVVAATNERLEDAVRSGHFREDLYFRLHVVPLSVPPLREREGDLELLIAHFADHPAVNLRGQPLALTPAARAALHGYGWPGNVRELRNLIEYLCFLPTPVIDVEDLPPMVRAAAPATAAQPEPPAAVAAAADDGGDERGAIERALAEAGGRRGQAARLLGIDRTTLWRRMYRHGLMR
jgi:transcriptional regulator with PAS, ATPase and Fis domain